MLRRWVSRICSLFRKEQLDRELSEELASHLALHTEENLRVGMTPEKARREALMKLGGVEQTKESVRGQRGLPLLEMLLQDLRFGLRVLGKSPGFTAVAILTLAIGIGASTAIFSIMYGILIRPLAVPEARQVVQLVLKDRGEVSQDNFTYNEFRYVQEHSDWSAAVAAFTHAGFNLSSQGGRNASARFTFRRIISRYWEPALFSAESSAVKRIIIPAHEWWFLATIYGSTALAATHWLLVARFI